MLNWWYSLIDFLLPFQWAHNEFMKNALLAVLLLTPLMGVLGTMVVNQRMAFFSDSLGHGAFTGIAIGALLGATTPLVAAILFSVLFAVGITLIQQRGTASSDTVISVFSSTAVALGLVLLTLGGSFSKFSAILVGDLLSVTAGDIAVLLAVLLGVLVLWVVLFNRVLLLSVNPALAASRGVNTLAVQMAFTIAVAVVVTCSIQWVGLLLVNSLLVLPAAAARNVSGNVRSYHLWSVALALVSGVGGLIISFYAGAASGAVIVLAAAALFFVTYALRGRVRR